ncbi:MAG: biopolymer transport protein TolQ, partial [Polaromonas sp.]
MNPETAALAADIDFSLLALFARATITVKIVMILLVVMSVWSWAITIQKVIAFRAARKELSQFETLFWSGQALDDLYDALGPQPDGPAQEIFAAGMTE